MNNVKYPQMSLLLQGPVSDGNKLDFMDSISYYRTLFSEIILTTYTEHLAENWKIQKFCEENGIKIIHQTDKIGNVVNPNNVYYHTYTTVKGLEHITNKYVLKHRVDERYSNLNLLIDKFFVDDIKYVTGGTFFGQKSYYEYHAGDRLVACKTESLLLAMKITIDQLNNGVVDAAGPEIIFTKNFLRAVGEDPTSENHDSLMRKYVDYLPDKYMEPFIIRSNAFNQIWRCASDLGRVNDFETIEDMLNSPEVVLNQFYY
jgi:hypothetical protein